MVEEFIEGLITTNRYHQFFVDWSKARSYQEQYKDELALLGALSHPGADPEAELMRLLISYPKINMLLPLLAAIRLKNNTAHIVDEITLSEIAYSFTGSNMDKAKAEKSLEFAKKTGLLSELQIVKSHSDYYFGVEVGMDTNARKNRSGTAMESLIEPYARELVEKFNGKLLAQTTFQKASKEFNVDIPVNEAAKRGDFMLFINGVPINIEVNYFDGGGSKQEIMNSYIPRAESLNKAGWVFALVTDGAGWRKNKKQIELGYRTIKNIYNAKMCKDGRLIELLELSRP